MALNSLEHEVMSFNLRLDEGVQIFVRFWLPKGQTRWH